MANQAKRALDSPSQGLPSFKKVRPNGGGQPEQPAQPKASTCNGVASTSSIPPLRISIRPSSAIPSASGVSTPPIASTSAARSNLAAPQNPKKSIRMHIPSSSASSPSIVSRAVPKTLASSGVSVTDVGPCNIAGHHFDLQDGRCLKREYTAAKRCTTCVNKQAGSECLFHGLRVFVIPDPPGTFITAKTPTFFASFYNAPRPLAIPSTFNRPLEQRNRAWLSDAVKSVLCGILEKSVNHAQLRNAILRPGDHRDRHTCDFCLTSLFISYWFCGECGREYCHDCHERIVSYLPSIGKQMHATDARSAMKLAAEQDQGGNSSDSAASVDHSSKTAPVKTTNASGGGRLLNPSPLAKADYDRLPESLKSPHGRVHDVQTRKLLSCVSGRLHGADFMLPVTKQGRDDLKVLRDKVLWSECDYLGSSHQSSAIDQKIGELTAAKSTSEPLRVHCSETLQWTRSRPMVISGVHDKLEIDWTPANFAAAFSTEKCEILDCYSGNIRTSRVSDFFNSFGKDPTTRDGSWKLKDWPDNQEFRTWQPDLYEDFLKAMPMPDWTRPDGVLNLAARFPSDAVKPDLGPKLYCAHRSTDAIGLGTTRLHLDAADAMNLMVWASNHDGQPSEALWHIWPADKTEIVKEYCYEILARSQFQKGQFIDAETLKNKVAQVKKEHDDRIHLQVYYLDASMRAHLAQRGAKAFEIRQKVGEAITIPAGCVHQVCNLADCIKIAVDFVSPDSVRQCLQITSEYRKLTAIRSWKEDLLQLKSMLYYNWLSLNPPKNAVPAPAANTIATSASKAAEITQTAPDTITTINKVVSSRQGPPAAAQGPLPTSVQQTEADLDSPAISGRPLRRLRGRSPSDIVPVLKPGTKDSGVRTRPAVIFEHSTHSNGTPTAAATQIGDISGANARSDRRPVAEEHASGSRAVRAQASTSRSSAAAEQGAQENERLFWGPSEQLIGHFQHHHGDEAERSRLKEGSAAVVTAGKAARAASAAEDAMEEEYGAQASASTAPAPASAIARQAVEPASARSSTGPVRAEDGSTKTATNAVSGRQDVSSTATMHTAQPAEISSQNVRSDVADKTASSSLPAGQEESIPIVRHTAHETGLSTSSVRPDVVPVKTTGRPTGVPSQDRFAMLPVQLAHINTSARSTAAPAVAATAGNAGTGGPFGNSAPIRGVSDKSLSNSVARQDRHAMQPVHLTPVNGTSRSPTTDDGPTPVHSTKPTFFGNLSETTRRGDIPVRNWSEPRPVGLALANAPTHTKAPSADSKRAASIPRASPIPPVLQGITSDPSSRTSTPDQHRRGDEHAVISNVAAQRAPNAVVHEGRRSKPDFHRSIAYTVELPPPERLRDLRGTCEAAYFKHLYG